MTNIEINIAYPPLAWQRGITGGRQYICDYLLDFVKIHPFVDGNGRTARLLMNLELIKAGFPAVVLPVEQRLHYYEALDAAQVRGEYGPFLALLEACVE